MVTDVLEQLAREYRASLPRKVDAIAEAVLARDGAEARALAHRLGGTSGSYGFVVVGERARLLEAALDERVDWPRVDELLADLRAAALEG